MSSFGIFVFISLFTVLGNRVFKLCLHRPGSFFAVERSVDSRKGNRGTWSALMRNCCRGLFETVYKLSRRGYNLTWLLFHLLLSTNSRLWSFHPFPRCGFSASSLHLLLRRSSLSAGDCFWAGWLALVALALAVLWSVISKVTLLFILRFWKAQLCYFFGVIQGLTLVAHLPPLSPGHSFWCCFLPAGSGQPPLTEVLPSDWHWNEVFGKASCLSL